MGSWPGPGGRRSLTSGRCPSRAIYLDQIVRWPLRATGDRFVSAHDRVGCPLAKQVPAEHRVQAGTDCEAQQVAKAPCLCGALDLRLVLVEGFVGGSPAADGHPLARAWMSERLASVLDELS
jgi:hypothetical protein